MTLAELRYIVALAETRHFSLAAEKCFVSQPTLSVAVKKLEEELGVTLFERSRQQVLITPLGQRIVERARRVLHETEEIKTLASSAADPLQGPLRMGVIYTIGPYLLPRLIPQLRELAPQMPLQLEENFTAVLGEKLARGELDVVVLALPYAAPGVETLALYREPFVAALPPQHPLSKEPEISDRALAKETVFLLGQGHCFRDQVVSAYPGLTQPREQGVLGQSLEGGSLETIRYMVASGSGISLLPAGAAQPDSAAPLLTIRPLAPPVPYRTVALAWRDGFPRQAAIHVLAKAVQAALPHGSELINS